MPHVHPDVLRSGDTAAIQAAEALVKALTTPDWGLKKFQAGNMTRKLEAGLLPYAAIPEVRQVLDAIKSKQALDSRLIHNVLSDPNAHVFQPLKKGDDDGPEGHA